MSEAISEAFKNLLIITGDFLSQFPLLRHVVLYIRRSYQNDPYRVVLEILLASIVLYYILKGDKRKELEVPEAVNITHSQPMLNVVNGTFRM